jgi:BirA family biotin operon repressor/biotin-[acetyl-CoA-carboxylase] ligase
VPFASLPLQPVTLVPLRVGTLIHGVLKRQLPPDCELPLFLKWPNDILLGEGKLSGMLLEVDAGHLLVGIGVNLNSVPDVPRHVLA